MKRFILSLTLALFWGSWAHGALFSTIGGDGLSESEAEELVRPLREEMVLKYLR